MNEKEEQVIGILYQDVINSIRYSKKQTWNTIYLTLIAIGAIWALFLSLQSKPESRLILTDGFLRHLHIVFYVVAGLGILYIIRYHGSITAYRFDKEDLLKKLSCKRQESEPKERKWYVYLTKFFWSIDFFFFVLPFCVLIALATGLVLHLLSSI